MRETVQEKGYDALAAAHSRALARLSRDIAARRRARCFSIVPGSRKREMEVIGKRRRVASSTAHGVANLFPRAPL